MNREGQGGKEQVEGGVREKRGGEVEGNEREGETVRRRIRREDKGGAKTASQKGAQSKDICDQGILHETKE